MEDKRKACDLQWENLDDKRIKHLKNHTIVPIVDKPSRGERHKDNKNKGEKMQVRE